jgi:hypothetical protein
VSAASSNHGIQRDRHREAVIIIPTRCATINKFRANPDAGAEKQGFRRSARARGRRRAWTFLPVGSLRPAG